MLHPYTPKHWATEKRSLLQARRPTWAGLGEKTGRLRNLGRLSQRHGKEHRVMEVRGASPGSAKITFLQSLELAHNYRGGWCIPRTNHGTANSGVVLRPRWNKFVWAAFWKVDSHKDRLSMVHFNFRSCLFDGQADFTEDSLSFLPTQHEVYNLNCKGWLKIKHP